MNKIFSKGASVFKPPCACSFTFVFNDKTEPEHRIPTVDSGVDKNYCMLPPTCLPLHKLKTLCLCLLVITNNQGHLLQGFIWSEEKQTGDR